MACTNCGKVKIPCVERTEANCVFVETEVLSSSKYVEEECVTLPEILEEIYEAAEGKVDESDFAEFSSDCLEIENKTALGVITALNNKVCEQQEEIEWLKEPCNILGMDISECGIDISCLGIDPCNNAYNITTIKDLFTTLLTEICNLKTQ